MSGHHKRAYLFGKGRRLCVYDIWPMSVPPTSSTGQSIAASGSSAKLNCTAWTAITSPGPTDSYYKDGPVTIATTGATYMDMDIERIEPSRTQEGGYFREVTISIVKIPVTKVKTPIPASYGKSGASAATAQSTAASARRMDPVYCRGRRP